VPACTCYCSRSIESRPCSSLHDDLLRTHAGQVSIFPGSAPFPFCLCSLIRTASGLPVSPMQFLPHSQGHSTGSALYSVGTKYISATYRCPRNALGRSRFYSTVSLPQTCLTLARRPVAVRASKGKNLECSTYIWPSLCLSNPLRNFGRAGNSQGKGVAPLLNRLTASLCTYVCVRNNIHYTTLCTNCMVTRDVTSHHRTTFHWLPLLT
jgi:hypothetical protein